MKLSNTDQETHKAVCITVYFEKTSTDDEVMKFVDNLLHDYPNVKDYEYDHPRNRL